MSGKKFQKVKERDGQVRDIIEDEVLSEKIDKDLMLVVTTFAALTLDSVYNISILNGKFAEAKSKNKKLEEENINLNVEVNKKRKVNEHLN